MDTTAQPHILTQRYSELQDWLKQVTLHEVKEVLALAGDASFRRYYRALLADKSYVLMDAPPDRESCHAFVAIAKSFKKIGVAVPEVHHQDLTRGFLLLSDLGDRLYLHELTPQNVNLLYQRAFTTLLTIQECEQVEGYALPLYDEVLLRAELMLFCDWYLAKYRKIALSDQEYAQLFKIFTLLINNAKEQPQTCVHRDYHSRNLLIYQNQKVGVLDFQDAVLGAITYDLVSLLKDCYIAWPEQQIYAWVKEFYDALKERDFLGVTSYEQFVKWFDWMGLQRHLKCLGIFTRLYLRDQRSGYLGDLPRTLNYIKQVCQKYPELSGLLTYL